MQYQSLEDVVGQLMQVAQDQNGCRFLQRKFDEGGAAAVAVVFPQVGLWCRVMVPGSKHTSVGGAVVPGSLCVGVGCAGGAGLGSLRADVGRGQVGQASRLHVGVGVGGAR